MVSSTPALQTRLPATRNRTRTACAPRLRPSLPPATRRRHRASPDGNCRILHSDWILPVNVNTIATGTYPMKRGFALEILKEQQAYLDPRMPS